MYTFAAAAAADDSSPRSDDILTPPGGAFKRFAYALSLPLIVAVYVTTPDARKSRFRHCVPLTFIMAIFWIGAFSYVMVWMIAIIGEVMV